jgi:hypothetical protein
MVRIPSTTHTAALATLHTQGLDFDVSGEQTVACSDVLARATCGALAQQLAKSLDASLALSNAPERDGFRQVVTALGTSPDTCDIIP